MFLVLYLRLWQERNGWRGREGRQWGSVSDAWGVPSAAEEEAGPKVRPQIQRGDPGGWTPVSGIFRQAGRSLLAGGIQAVISSRKG